MFLRNLIERVDILSRKGLSTPFNSLRILNRLNTLQTRNYADKGGKEKDKDKDKGKGGKPAEKPGGAKQEEEEKITIFDYHTYGVVDEGDLESAYPWLFASMEHKKKKTIDAFIPTQGASTGPPLGPILGQRGISTGIFVKLFNDYTKIFEPGIVVKCSIHPSEDRKNVKFDIHKPPTVALIKNLAVVDADGVKCISQENIVRIARFKFPNSEIKKSYMSVRGTVYSMHGFKIENEPVMEKKKVKRSEKALEREKERLAIQEKEAREKEKAEKEAKEKEKADKAAKEKDKEKGSKDSDDKKKKKKK
eukprot:TRINITY_DN10731_c0_g1_i1.p1 TRINITY_DN10731_c0_g1~~TRINITY_DN10731_c0_g1_i1.p1  ORF type:complete len:306 (-),score=61.69 TRINITY_DN10731_c0_g1_i1:10-927(-)